MCVSDDWILSPSVHETDGYASQHLTNSVSCAYKKALNSEVLLGARKSWLNFSLVFALLSFRCHRGNRGARAGEAASLEASTLRPNPGNEGTEGTRPRPESEFST